MKAIESEDKIAFVAQAVGLAQDRDHILLLDIYAKNEREDLNADQLKQLRLLVEDYRNE